MSRDSWGQLEELNESVGWVEDEKTNYNEPKRKVEGKKELSEKELSNVPPGLFRRDDEVIKKMNTIMSEKLRNLSYGAIDEDSLEVIEDLINHALLTMKSLYGRDLEHPKMKRYYSNFEEKMEDFREEAREKGDLGAFLTYQEAYKQYTKTLTELYDLWMRG